MCGGAEEVQCFLFMLYADIQYIPCFPLSSSKEMYLLLLLYAYGRLLFLKSMMPRSYGGIALKAFMDAL